MNAIRAIDLFCGAGGSSWGARKAGAEIVAAFDMWELATRTFAHNFRETEVINGNLRDYSARGLARKLGPIDLIIASPECTNHGPAKGNALRCEVSRESAFHVSRFARAFRPRWLVIENVCGMRRWDRYPNFRKRIEAIGYNVSEQVLNAAHFGVPQSRKRLFILCDQERQPPLIKSRTNRIRSVDTILNKNGGYSFSPLRTSKRAKSTLASADRAIAVVGNKTPFIIVYYGSDRTGGWQKVDIPLRTVTTLDRFAYVTPTKSGHNMRMLQPDELQRAMGMPKSFVFPHGSRRDRIKLIGNAVCPPLISRVVDVLTTNRSHESSNSA